MAAIYKSGAKWVVKTSTATYNLDSGDVILTETVDNLYFQLKLKDGLEQIINSSYELVKNESDVFYTKAQLVAVLDQMVVKQDASLYPSGKPVLLTAEFNRPADVLDYAANDRIGPATVAVKQKETMTLTGAVAAKQKQTLTISGGTAGKQKQTITLSGLEAAKQLETITLTGSAPTAQVETITLTGTSGTANVTVAGGLTKLVTFATGGTLDLAQTAADFVTSHTAAYLAADIVVTADGADIIFTDNVPGVGFAAPLITNATGDLAGTVKHTTANLIGTANITVAGGLTKLVTFATAGTADLTQTAADFVTAWADDYLAENIVITSDGADILFEAFNWGVGFDAPVITNLTGNLNGTVEQTVANLTHNGSVSIDNGNLGFTIIQKGTMANTVAEFVTDNAASFLNGGVVLTGDGASLILEAETAGTPFVWYEILSQIGDLHATSVQTTQNVPFGTASIGLPTVLTFPVTYATSLNATALAYKNAHAAAFLAVGITLTNSSADIIFEAAVAGTPFETVVISTVEGTLIGTVAPTTANVPLATGTISGAGGLSLPISYITSAAATALAFKTAHVAAYLAEGIVLTNSGDDIVFEAGTAGVPFTAPSLTKLTGTIAGAVVHTLDNITIEALEFSGDAGSSGYVSFIKIDAPAKFASQDLTLVLYKEQPSAMVGDNVAFVYDAANSLIRIGEIPVTMNAVINSSAIVRGQAYPFLTYVAGTSKKLYGVLTTGAEVVAPNTAGKFTIIVTTVQLS